MMNEASDNEDPIDVPKLPDLADKVPLEALPATPLDRDTLLDQSVELEMAFGLLTEQERANVARLHPDLDSPFMCGVFCAGPTLSPDRREERYLRIWQPLVVNALRSKVESIKAKSSNPEDIEEAAEKALRARNHGQRPSIWDIVLIHASGKGRSAALGPIPIRTEGSSIDIIRSFLTPWEPDDQGWHKIQTISGPPTSTNTLNATKKVIASDVMAPAQREQAGHPTPALGKAPVSAPQRIDLITLRRRFPTLLTGAGMTPKVFAAMFTEKGPPGGWSINNMAVSLSGNDKRPAGSTRQAISSSFVQLQAVGLAEKVGEVWQLGAIAMTEEGPQAGTP